MRKWSASDTSDHCLLFLDKGAGQAVQQHKNFCLFECWDCMSETWSKPGSVTVL